MKWRDYADDVNLFEDFDKTIKPLTDEQRRKNINTLIAYFSKEVPSKIYNLSNDEIKPRDILRGLLNVYPPKEIAPEILNMLHNLLLIECEERELVDVNDIEEVEEGIAIWRGNITNLRADAIVNAANNKLLGCLQPLHLCVDNEIHSCADPRLREDCDKIIKKQGHLEYTGDAKITRGYCLPAKFVVHTVGPIVSGGQPSKEQEKQLLHCYKSCLNTIKEIDEIKNIVFCGISTGVFGYPKKEAANLAVSRARLWLKENPEKNLKVVFNVFTEEEEEKYRRIFK